MSSLFNAGHGGKNGVDLRRRKRFEGILSRSRRSTTPGFLPEKRVVERGVTSAVGLNSKEKEPLSREERRREREADKKPGAGAGAGGRSVCSHQLKVKGQLEMEDGDEIDAMLHQTGGNL
nr:hypothetical protein CTI12_AA622980 [Ipomoea batatas]